MLDKAQRGKKLSNQDRQLPVTMQDLINRYDLENIDVYNYLDKIVAYINELENKVPNVNENYSESTINTYSCNYINQKGIWVQLARGDSTTLTQYTIDNLNKYSALVLQVTHSSGGSTTYSRVLASTIGTVEQFKGINDTWIAQYYISGETPFRADALYVNDTTIKLKVERTGSRAVLYGII